MNILVSRPDRIGDVLLSTPVLRAIKSRFSEAKVTFLVGPPVVPLVCGLDTVDDVLIYEENGKHRGVVGWRDLVREIRRARFDVVISLQSQRRLAMAFFAAGVRRRIGPLSKVHSFLFYNEGMRQRRSRVEKHEADYNLELLTPLGIHVERDEFKTQVSLDSNGVAFASDWLEKKSSKKKWVAVHPGMGGSASNWPESHYLELIRRLAELENCTVVVTGGGSEQILLERIKNKTKGLDVLFYCGGQERPVDYLGGIFTFCSVVVAPSTGPLHLAVALERPVVTFYPSMRVQSADRWGPYPKNKVEAKVFVGDSDMVGISVEDVYKSVIHYLNRNGS